MSKTEPTRFLGKDGDELYYVIGSGDDAIVIDDYDIVIEEDGSYHYYDERDQKHEIPTVAVKAFEQRNLNQELQTQMKATKEAATKELAKQQMIAAYGVDFADFRQAGDRIISNSHTAPITELTGKLAEAYNAHENGQSYQWDQRHDKGNALATQKQEAHRQQQMAQARAKVAKLEMEAQHGVDFDEFTKVKDGRITNKDGAELPSKLTKPYEKHQKQQAKAAKKQAAIDSKPRATNAVNAEKIKAAYKRREQHNLARSDGFKGQMKLERDNHLGQTLAAFVKEGRYSEAASFLGGEIVAMSHNMAISVRNVMLGAAEKLSAFAKQACASAKEWGAKVGEVLLDACDKGLGKMADAFKGIAKGVKELAVGAYEKAGNEFHQAGKKIKKACGYQVGALPINRSYTSGLFEAASQGKITTKRRDQLLKNYMEDLNAQRAEHNKGVWSRKFGGGKKKKSSMGMGY